MLKNNSSAFVKKSFSCLFIKLIAPNTLFVTRSLKGTENNLKIFMPEIPSIFWLYKDSFKLFNLIGKPEFITSLTKQYVLISIISGLGDL